MSQLPKYTPPKKREHVKHGPGQHPISQEACLKALKYFGNGATSQDVSTKTKYNRNHCGIILTALWKKGVVKRQKEAVGNVRFYRYYLKEQSCESN